MLKVSLTNRLPAELDAFWPGAAMIFCRLDSPIALAFLERYRVPQMPELWAKSASLASSPATATAEESPPRNCLRS